MRIDKTIKAPLLHKPPLPSLRCDMLTSTHPFGVQLVTLSLSVCRVNVYIIQ